MQWDSVVEILDVPDVHADAAVRRGAPDRPVLARAVDPGTVVEAHPTRLDRIIRARRNDLARQRARARAVRHVPPWIHLLVVDLVQAGRRLEPRLADGDAVGLRELEILVQPQGERLAADEEVRAEALLQRGGPPVWGDRAGRDVDAPPVVDAEERV